MRSNTLLLALALALAFAPALAPMSAHAAGKAAAAKPDDDAWLQKTMSAPMAPGVNVPPERAQRIEFTALARYLGHRARIETGDADTRGLIERVDAEHVVLRVTHSTGPAAATLARADVRTIWVD